MSRPFERHNFDELGNRHRVTRAKVKSVFFATDHAGAWPARKIPSANARLSLPATGGWFEDLPRKHRLLPTDFGDWRWRYRATFPESRRQFSWYRENHWRTAD